MTKSSTEPLHTRFCLRVIFFTWILQVPYIRLTWHFNSKFVTLVGSCAEVPDRCMYVRALVQILNAQIRFVGVTSRRRFGAFWSLLFLPRWWTGCVEQYRRWKRVSSIGAVPHGQLNCSPSWRVHQPYLLRRRRIAYLCDRVFNCSHTAFFGWGQFGFGVEGSVNANFLLGILVLVMACGWWWLACNMLMMSAMFVSRSCRDHGSPSVWDWSE